MADQLSGDRALQLLSHWTNIQHIAISPWTFKGDGVSGWEATTTFVVLGKTDTDDEQTVSGKGPSKQGAKGNAAVEMVRTLSNGISILSSWSR